jgi:hypothetical protein
VQTHQLKVLDDEASHKLALERTRVKEAAETLPGNSPASKPAGSAAGLGSLLILASAVCLWNGCFPIEVDSRACLYFIALFRC